MNKKQTSIKILVLISLAILFLPFGLIRAQESSAVATETLSDVTLDENVTAADLNIKEPTLLPTSPYYQIKNIWRGLRSTLTFDPVKKVELKLQYANEKLIEAKSMAKIENNQEAVVKAIKGYGKEMNQLTEIVENFSDELKKNSSTLTEKIIDNSFKQQKLIDGIEKGLENAQLKETNQIRTKALEKLGETIVNIVPSEQIQERIEVALQNQTGSEFKDLKNLGVLKIVEQKLPEKAAEAVQEVQKNILEKLEIKINSFQEQDKEKFQNYIENLGGSATAHLQIIKDISENGLPGEIGQKLEEIKEQIIEKVEKMEQGQVQIANPASEYCIKMGGKLEMKTDENKDQFGICHLPDGTDCEEWALFRGECGKNNEKETPSSGLACPEVTKPDCKNGILVAIEKDKNNCPLKYECMGLGEKKEQPEIPIIQPQPQITPVSPGNKRGESPCIQVITPAMKDGICKEFPTPCDVPEGWSRVNSCPSSSNSNVQIDSSRSINSTQPQQKQIQQPMMVPETMKTDKKNSEKSLGNPSLLEKNK